MIYRDDDAFRSHFHQTMCLPYFCSMKKFAILIAIPTDSYKQTQIRIDSSHVQDHYQDKHPEQTCEDEQVLRFSP
jgi:hypothetical protein